MRTGEAQHLTYVIGIGGRGRAVMPSSEACVTMGIAGKYMDFEVVDGGESRPFVQLFLTEPETQRYSQHFSGPITTGEAGLFDTKSTFDTPFPCYYHPHSLRHVEDDLRDTGKLDSEASLEPDYHPES